MNDLSQTGENSFFMQHAIDLAKSAKGKTAPNPCVGAVLVQNGKIVSSGYHTQYGQAHAEVEAINNAKLKNIYLPSCSLFVTLEPCNHFGQTPPCTHAILKSGIKKLFIGTIDANLDVAGGGARFLQNQGIDITIGVQEQACQDLISDFYLWKSTKRTYNILKLATSIDGKIGTRLLGPQKISGQQSKNYVHELRAKVQSIIVGGTTFRVDNPQLTCRLENFVDKQPLAVVVTKKLQISDMDLSIMKDRAEDICFWTTKEQAETSLADDYRKRGCEIIGLEQVQDNLSLIDGFIHLRAQHNAYYTLCEGGGTLAMNLLKQGLMDEFQHIISPKIFGDDRAINSFSGHICMSFQDIVQLRRTQMEVMGEDVVIHYMK